MPLQDYLNYHVVRPAIISELKIGRLTRQIYRFSSEKSVFWRIHYSLTRQTGRTRKLHIITFIMAASLNMDEVRGAFPALKTDQIFLDNAGGSQTLGTVAEA